MSKKSDNKKKEEKQKVEEFFNEVEVKKSLESSKEKLANDFTEKSSNEPKLIYKCPACHKLLEKRNEPCKHCGYSGYIPMNDSETKKIRKILFVVILVIAVVVYLATI